MSECPLPHIYPYDCSLHVHAESDKQQLFKAAQIIQNAFRTYKVRSYTLEMIYQLAYTVTRSESHEAGEGREAFALLGL